MWRGCKGRIHRRVAVHEASRNIHKIHVTLGYLQQVEKNKLNSVDFFGGFWCIGVGACWSVCM